MALIPPWEDQPSDLYNKKVNQFVMDTLMGKQPVSKPSDKVINNLIDLYTPDTQEPQESQDTETNDQAWFDRFMPSDEDTKEQQKRLKTAAIISSIANGLRGIYDIAAANKGALVTQRPGDPFPLQALQESQRLQDNYQQRLDQWRNAVMGDAIYQNRFKQEGKEFDRRYDKQRTAGMEDWETQQQKAIEYGKQKMEAEMPYYQQKADIEEGKQRNVIKFDTDENIRQFEKTYGDYYNARAKTEAEKAGGTGKAGDDKTRTFDIFYKKDGKQESLTGGTKLTSAEVSGLYTLVTGQIPDIQKVLSKWGYSKGYRLEQITDPRIQQQVLTRLYEENPQAKALIDYALGRQKPQEDPFDF